MLHTRRISYLVLPYSVDDFNEMEEDNWNINQMPDHEVTSEFEKMLENMNLSEVRSESTTPVVTVTDNLGNWQTTANIDPHNINQASTFPI